MRRLHRATRSSSSALRGDRRELIVEFTDGGQAVVDAVTTARLRDIRRLLGRIPERRRNRVLLTVEELARAAGQEPTIAFPLGWPS